MDAPKVKQIHVLVVVPDQQSVSAVAAGEWQLGEMVEETQWPD
ncbi:hypothetical protein PPTG_23634 [Phytophthora nicotianae INRA-310]|uniref:Uncharacterized protein n=1 Tax=Phytophthora nicotianae (strain INRA-310) TaxID=761204 RepID=W2PU88_PHYN3|nr:hypothetical protein PPTG_23634 [Phytophthora nicotianae INRA-310]ETN04186.1 hypothetical protein PPTG_23634 [Phytophthora nicotianae INRA-310]